jgi:hypothetical protein
MQNSGKEQAPARNRGAAEDQTTETVVDFQITPVARRA